MGKCLLILFYVSECIKYSVGAKICFGTDIKRKRFMIVGFLLYVLWISFTSLTDIEINLTTYIMAVIVVYGSAVEQWREDLLHILMLLFLMTGIDGTAGILWKKIDFNNVWIKQAEVVIVSWLSTAAWLVGYIYTKEKGNTIRSSKISFDYIWLLVICLIATIMIMSSLVTTSAIYEAEESYSRLANAVKLLVYITIIILMVFLIYIRRVNIRLKEKVNTERELKESQKQYYHSLLQKEEDTRKSRHDWQNHLICLNELAKKNNVQNIQKYIEELIDQLKDIADRQIEVGNDVVNAILNYYLMEPLKDAEIEITIEGKCKANLQIEDTELCVIVSNIVKNAVEYVSDKKGMEKKKIHIKFEYGGFFQKITVSNSIAEDFQMKSITTTYKKDTRNHGIGLENVKKAVEKNHGKIFINVVDHMYQVEVIIR